MVKLHFVKQHLAGVLQTYRTLKTHKGLHLCYVTPNYIPNTLLRTMHGAGVIGLKINPRYIPLK